MTKEKEELSNNTFIRDEKIEPYFIGKDSHCYTVYETITPDTRYTENNVAGKDYTKALGHYSNFGNCLKAIARNKTNDKQTQLATNSNMFNTLSVVKLVGNSSKKACVIVLHNAND
jgi:hypothetical protein